VSIQVGAMAGRSIMPQAVPGKKVFLSRWMIPVSRKRRFGNDHRDFVELSPDFRAVWRQRQGSALIRTGGAGSDGRSRWFNE
jgi:hypothetical protein